MNQRLVSGIVGLLVIAVIITVIVVVIVQMNTKPGDEGKSFKDRAENIFEHKFDYFNAPSGSTCPDGEECPDTKSSPDQAAPEKKTDTQKTPTNGAKEETDVTTATPSTETPCSTCVCKDPVLWPFSGCDVACGAKCGDTCCAMP